MNNENKINPDAIVNPSSGMIIRNPTRIEITKDSETQQDIVESIRGQKQHIEKVVYDYLNVDQTDPPPLAGVIQIREMDEDQIEGFFKCLMRIKPNILKIHLKLGEYTNKRELRNNRTNLLNANKQRYPTEVAKRMADVFNDHTSNVVEVIYTVNHSEPNYFSVNAKVYSAEDKDYKNDEIFAPVIGIQYIASH